MVHFTESCDVDAPHLIVHADTTPANVHEAMRTGPIHDALAAKGLAPSEHLADAGYVSAAHIVAARERHCVDLFGPARPDQSWQKQEEGAFHAADFAVDWERRRVRCPEGHESTTWGEYTDRASGQSYIRAGFSPAQCRSCPSRSRCTRAASRRLGLLPRPEHEAIAAVRARLETKAGRRLYGQRQGIEGTISQGVRVFGLRRARYRGLAKTGLQSVATAAAINLDRLGAWFAGRPLAPTRTSRFGALAA
jgi:Transposase DDE domain